MSQIIIPVLVSKALDAIPKPKEPRKLTDAEKRMQKFFDTNPFDCKTTQAAALVHLLTGFDIELKSGPLPEMLTVWKRKNVNPVEFRMTISTKTSSSRYGISSTNCANFYWETTGSCEMATPDESRKFITEVVAKWNDAEFMGWMTRTLGEPYIKELMSFLNS